MSSGCVRGKKGERLPWNLGLFMVVGVMRIGRSSLRYVYVYVYVYAVRHV